MITDIMMEHIIGIGMLSMLVVIAIAIIMMRNLVIASILGGIFSLIMAGMFVLMDAADVALTESAVGAGFSTLLFLAAIRLAGRQEKAIRPQFLPLLVCALTGGVLLYATTDMPRFGDPEAAPHTHVAPRYLRESAEELAPKPNVVALVLASYRGFDTMGEVVVVFCAGAGVMMLIGGRRRKKSDSQAKDSPDPSKAEGETA